MNKNVGISILCLFVWVGCSSPEQDQLEILQSDVLAIHDEVMPQMGTLSELKSNLTEHNEAIKAGNDSTAADRVIVNELVITNLDLAHEGMMGWMRQFQKVDLADDVASNKAYLEDQLSKIQQVQTDVDNAIRSAEEALSN